MNPYGFSRQTVCQQDVSSMSGSNGLWKQLEKALRNKTAGVWTGNRSHTGEHQSWRIKPSLPCLRGLHYLSNSFVFRSIWLNSDLNESCSARAEAEWLLVPLLALDHAALDCQHVLFLSQGTERRMRLPVIIPLDNHYPVVTVEKTTWWRLAGKHLWAAFRNTTLMLLTLLLLGCQVCCTTSTTYQE